MLTAPERAKLAAILGVMDRPGLATGFPDLVQAMNRLYEDRISKIPWIPPTWLASVREVQAKNPGDLIIPTPGRDLSGARGQMAPSFADTDAKLDVWHTIYNDVNGAIVSFAAKYQEQGAAKLAQLYAAAAFWDAAYHIADFAKNLPANIVKQAAGGVSAFVGTFLPDSLKAYAKWVTAAIVLLIIGGVVMWYRKKLGGIVKGFKAGVG